MASPTIGFTAPQIDRPSGLEASLHVHEVEVEIPLVTGVSPA